MIRTRNALIALWFAVAFWPLSTSAAASQSTPGNSSWMEQRRPQLTLAPGPPVDIELDPRFGAGDASSPVVLVLYACGRSEPCATLIPSLYDEVRSGRLAGRVRLYYRPFFPNETDAAAACGRALVAAADQGRFWPFLLHLYQQREAFQQCLLRKWADIKGLDSDAFQIAYHHPRTTALLATARREGIRNKVDVIPTAFIDGHRVEGRLSVEALIALLEQQQDVQASSQAAPGRSPRR